MKRLFISTFTILLVLLFGYWKVNHRKILMLPKFIAVESSTVRIHPVWERNMDSYVLRNEKKYWIGSTLVSNKAYNLYKKLTLKKENELTSFSGENQPVVNISWEGASRYISWLNIITLSNYRLPTESEWEVAARAGSQRKYTTGDILHKNMANCIGCSADKLPTVTTNVNHFLPNSWGFYDAQGNVWEWVHDCFTKRKQIHMSQKESLLRENCTSYFVKGGSWANKASFVSPSKRFALKSDWSDKLHGFRLAYTDRKPSWFETLMQKFFDHVLN